MMFRQTQVFSFLIIIWQVTDVRFDQGDLCKHTHWVISPSIVQKAGQDFFLVDQKMNIRAGLMLFRT